jgi:hypothetical protein
MEQETAAQGHTGIRAEPGRQATSSADRVAHATPWSIHPLATWREHPERLAWLILLASFAVFLVLAVSIPATLRHVLRYATVEQQAQLEPTRGTLLLYQPRAEEPIAITAPRQDISEGSRIVTSDDAATQGVLGLVADPDTDELLGTVQLYPGTTLEIERLRQPQFASSPESHHVHLRLQQGRTRIFTQSGGIRPLLVEVETPQGLAVLGEGIYNLSVVAERTEITVRAGQARLGSDRGNMILITAGLRSTLVAGEAPQPPVSAERNLVENGEFNQPLLESGTWESYSVANDVVPGWVRFEDQDGRRVAHFVRQGEEGVHTEVGIRQTIDQDVNVYESLKIELDVKLMRQTLPGAGTLSSEFPIRVEISYTDGYGKDLQWGWGFYYRDPRAGWYITNGEKIPPFRWYSYQSENLMELLDAEGIRPSRVDSIRIYASGYNYEAMVSGISLIAQ